MDEELKEKIINLSVEGLCCDGGHHKQYYLEEILKLVTHEHDFIELKDLNEWEEGIPD